MNIEQVLIPLMNTLLLALLAFIGKEAIVLAPKFRDFFESKLGSTIYEEMMKFGFDAWSKIEEDNRLGDLVLSKAKTFEQLMLKKFPQLDGDEINFINKAIAGELNKDKRMVAAEISSDTSQMSTVAEQENIETMLNKYVTEASQVGSDDTSAPVFETSQVPVSNSASAANIVIINGVEYAPLQVAQG